MTIHALKAFTTKRAAAVIATLIATIIVHRAKITMAITHSTSAEAPRMYTQDTTN